MSSVYDPMANKRAEVAVKQAKCLIEGNLGAKGELETERLHTWPVQMVCKETRMAGQSSMKKIAHTHSTLHELLPGVVSVFSSLAD